MKRLAIVPVRKTTLAWMTVFGLSPVLVPALIVTLILSGCGMFSNLGGGETRSAKDQAAKALNMTTKSAVAFMTLAGAAYQAGAWGPPGSPRAEDVRDKLSAESIRMSEALTAWADALEANKDTSPYQLVVATALAVITALLPPKNAELQNLAPDLLQLTASRMDGSARELAADLSRPEMYLRFPRLAEVSYGGAR